MGLRSTSWNTPVCRLLLMKDGARNALLNDTRKLLFASGFSSSVVSGFAVIALTNSEDGSPHLYVNQAYSIVAPAIAKAAAATAKVPTADPAWSKYEGVYVWEDEEIHVAVLDGRLTIFDPAEDNPWAERITLEPVSGNVFRQKDGFAAGY